MIAGTIFQQAAFAEDQRREQKFCSRLFWVLGGCFAVENFRLAGSEELCTFAARRRWIRSM